MEIVYKYSQLIEFAFGKVTNNNVIQIMRINNVPLARIKYPFGGQFRRVFRYSS